MNVLVVSDGGLGRGLAQRCERDGHDVKFGRPELADWRPDIVIYDGGKNHVQEADQLRNAGFKVLGPTRWSTAIEEDSTYLKQIITSLGWNVNGLTQGTNIYISAWFNGASFVSSYMSIVYRRFMPGGAGPDLECTGMLSCFTPTTNQTYYTFLEPLGRMLKKINHRGPVHIHALVNGTGYCVKEIFTSFTHPLSLTLFENSNGSASDLILSLFEETSRRVRPLSPWSSGVQLSIPPYPYNYSSDYKEIAGIVPGNLKHLWMADVESEGGKYATAGLIGYVTARGEDENECVRRMYRTVGNISAPDMQYRNDVGKNVQSLLTSIKQAGWIQ